MWHCVVKSRILFEILLSVLVEVHSVINGLMVAEGTHRGICCKVEGSNRCATCWLWSYSVRYCDFTTIYEMAQIEMFENSVGMWAQADTSLEFRM